MPDFEITLSDSEASRLRQVAFALGTTPEQLAADELRRRYLLPAAAGNIVPLLPRANTKGLDHGHD